MYLDELQSVIDSVQLVDEYHSHHEVKQYIDSKFLYKNNRYVTEFISRLNTFSPVFAKQWQKVTQGKAIGPKRFWSDDFKTRVGNYLEYAYSTPNELNSVLNRAIAYYTQTNPGLTAQQIAYLRNLQMESGRGKINSLSRFIKQLNRRPQAGGTLPQVGLKPDQQQTQQPALQRAVLTPAQALAGAPNYDNLGQPLPVSFHPLPDLEVIHANEEPSTANQATMPISQIRAQAQNLASRGRQVLRPVAEEVFSRGKVVAIRAQPIKQTRNLGSYILRQIPFISPAGRGEFVLPPGGRGGLRAGISTARVGASTARSAGLLARAAPAIANPYIAIGIAILAIIVLIMFNFDRNTTLCPPWQSCSMGKGLGDSNVVPASTLIVTKDGPLGGAVPDDSPITYTINVTYKGVGTAKVDLTDKIPTDTKFASATPNDSGVFERKNPDTPQESLVWHLTDLKTNQSKQVSFTVNPQKRDFWAVNNAAGNVTGVSGVGGQGLLCVADVDPRLVPFFEQGAVAANLPPALMYAVAKGEQHSARIDAISLDGKLPLISECGAHGIMQILHVNDGTPGAPQTYAACTTLDSWNSILKYNAQTGGKLNNVDNDEDNIWGSSFFVRYEKINNAAYFRSLPDYTAFKNKSFTDQYTDQEITAIARAYYGGPHLAYETFYLNAYHQAIASQGTCGN